MKPRKMTGFLAGLTPEQQAAILAYDGPESNIGVWPPPDTERDYCVSEMRESQKSSRAGARP